MELNQDDFLNNQNDDLRNSADYDAGADNDEIGENSEQTPVAKALQEDRSKAENKGWENNQPGITTNNENDQRVPTVTPQNDNGVSGPDDDDFGDDDDDDDDELIPIETDDDDDFLTDDDDDVDDLLDEDEDADVDPNAHSHIDISKIAPNEDRPFGRTSGRMIDHEPGITNNPE
jgi:hypothetical protein